MYWIGLDWMMMECEYEYSIFDCIGICFIDPTESNGICLHASTHAMGNLQSEPTDLHTPCLLALLCLNQYL